MKSPEEIRKIMGVGAEGHTDEELLDIDQRIEQFADVAFEIIWKRMLERKSLNDMDS